MSNKIVLPRYVYRLYRSLCCKTKCRFPSFLSKNYIRVYFLHHYNENNPAAWKRFCNSLLFCMFCSMHIFLLVDLTVQICNEKY